MSEIPANECAVIHIIAIQKRIEELEKIQGKEVWEHMELDTLKHVLSQSAPLIPEIEKGIRQGLSICLNKKDWSYGISGSVKQDIQDYISNLKLNI